MVKILNCATCRQTTTGKPCFVAVNIKDINTCREHEITNKQEVIRRIKEEGVLPF